MDAARTCVFEQKTATDCTEIAGPSPVVYIYRPAPKAVPQVAHRRSRMEARPRSPANSSTGECGNNRARFHNRLYISYLAAHILPIDGKKHAR
jgi:hypothetical protein